MLRALAGCSRSAVVSAPPLATLSEGLGATRRRGSAGEPSGPAAQDLKKRAYLHVPVVEGARSFQIKTQKICRRPLANSVEIPAFSPDR